MDDSEFLALADWWGTKGLAEWRSSKDARAVLQAVSARLLRKNALDRPLPWIANSSGPASGSAGVEWWPVVGTESRLRFANIPCLLTGDSSFRGADLLDTMAAIAASGRHHLVIVDPYAAAVDASGQSRHGRFLLDTIKPRLDRMRSEGHAVASVTVICGDSDTMGKPGLDPRLLRSALQNCTWYRQVQPDRMRQAFHDRFLLVLADDTSLRYRGNPIVACVLLGSGLDTLAPRRVRRSDDRADVGSVSAIARLPPRTCGFVAERVTHMLNRCRGSTPPAPPSPGAAH